MSRFGEALALIGAGTAGWMNGVNQAKKNQQLEEDRAFEREQRDRQRKQWNKDDATDAALADAARPAQIESTPPVQPTEYADITPGSDGAVIRERALPGRNAVNGVNMGTEASAAAAAQPLNDPLRMTRRQADAVQALNPRMAAQLRQSANTEELAQLQLSEAQQKRLDTEFERSLGKATTHDELAQLMSDSAAGGKYTTVMSPDGKRVAYLRVNPDGTQVSTGKEYPVGDKGLQLAKLDLSRTASVGDKLTHLHQEAQEEHQKAQLDQQALDRASQRDTQIKVANIQAGSHLQGIKMQTDALAARAAATAAGKPPAKADHFDEKEWNNAFKIDTSLTGVDSGDGKPAQVPELRVGWQQAFNEARRSGQMSPNEAAEYANSTVLKLRQLAENRMAAAPKDKPLTYSQATQQVLKEAYAPKPQPGQPGQPGAQPAPARPTPPPMPAAAPQQAAPIQRSPQMDAQVQQEMLEMSEGRRMQWSSPQLAAYAQAMAQSQQQSAEQQRLAATSAAAAQENARRRALGY